MSRKPLDELAMEYCIEHIAMLASKERKDIKEHSDRAFDILNEIQRRVGDDHANTAITKAFKILEMVGV